MFGFKRSALSLAVLAGISTPTLTQAQEAPAADNEIEKIAITATRRASTVQEAPVNITALTSDVMSQQNLGELADIARWVPGLTIADQGGRSESPIIVRGLNTNSSGPDNDGGTVATYVGEIPMAIDMRLIDVDRVEVLIGPQGTLYGAGTMGGAIRYLANKVELDVTNGSFSIDGFQGAESDSMGSEVGFVFNTPIIEDVLGLRVAYNRYNDPGFIDYNYVVKNPGSSLPDPDFTDSAAVADNLKSIADANGDTTTTAKIALRYMPTDWLDGTLTYMTQEREVEGRSITQYNGLATTHPLADLIGPYESAYRYEEPYKDESSLLALEVSADLGFAELVAAVGRSENDGLGQRDQTDLLIRLDYSYEEFPSFAAFTRETVESTTDTTEIRLVSDIDSDFSFIVGYYSSETEAFGQSLEFTPGLSEYWGVDRPDNLEYASEGYDDVSESAFFGEISYQVTDKLDITVGTRVYDYEINSRSGVDLPLLYAAFYDGPSEGYNIEFEDVPSDGDGNLMKYNLSYKFSDDIMAYATISEGFRLGGGNGVAACPDNVPEDKQIVCALPNEVVYLPDTTTNHELGFKSSWMKNKFHFNAALFNVTWDDAQVGGATVNGQQPITLNAKGAESRGVEISTRAILSDELTMYATFSTADATLKDDAPFLFAVESNPDYQDYYDGKAGDRLPGAPEQQASFGLNYSMPVMDDKLLDINFGTTYQSDVITKVGMRADGETLPGFSVSNLSATLSDMDWSLTLYIDNLFDKYAFTGSRANLAYINQANFADKNFNRSEDLLRSYGHFVIKPRTIGLKFKYNFEL